MECYVLWTWVLGVSEPRGRRRSALCGLPMRPSFRPRRSKGRLPVPEPLSPDSRCRLPQPSWVTTAERAAWGFGA